MAEAAARDNHDEIVNLKITDRQMPIFGPPSTGNRSLVTDPLIGNKRKERGDNDAGQADKSKRAKLDFRH